MYGDVEELVLSGKLFNGVSPSSSPTRSRSTSPAPHWPDVNSDIDDSDGGNGVGSGDDVLDELEDTSGFPKLKNSSAKGGVRSGESIGMKPGRTGVKGVIRDRNEMEDIERERRGRRNKELNDKMESMNLGGMTYEEEKAFEDREMKRRLAEEDWEETRRTRRALRSGRFGHLREVGVSNFVSAIEDEARGVWVVVHLYDQTLDRCITLDATLSGLARSHPFIKFLRTRAGALGFATPSASTPNHKHAADDGDDIDSDPESLQEEPEVDTDMLPTILVYRDGQLVHNWVRVDWVIKEQTAALDIDIQSLLEKHGILTRNTRERRQSSSDDSGSLDIEFEHDLDY